MAGVIKRPGDIFKVPLSGGLHGYAQWLPDGTARVFAHAGKTMLPLADILKLAVAFRVLVARASPGKHGWSKIGKAPFPRECSEPQRYAKRDVISGAVRLYYRGVESPASEKDVRGLETLAVWGHPHIVERLEAQLAGRKSKSLEQVRAVA